MNARSIPVGIGNVLELTVSHPVAGGFCIARHEGQVIFLRGALPGETVRAQVTSAGKRGGFLRGRVVEVLSGSSARISPPCRHFGVCGGCDWQHASRATQLEIKAAVVREALSRTGGLSEIGGVPLEQAVSVQAMDESGLGWRTRMRFAVDTDQTIGLRAARSNRIIPAADCLLPVAELQQQIPFRYELSSTSPVPAPADDLLDRSTDALLAVASNHGQVFVGDYPQALAAAELTETVRDRDFLVRPEGFWQVHPRAASALLDLVLTYTDPQPGETALDLYSGVGLFSAFVAEAVAVTGRVDAVESGRAAVKLAKRNTRDLAWLHHHKSDVGKWLEHRRPRAEVVVLDPPRAGAGLSVVESLIAAQPRVIAYVACDPVSFARDVKWLRERGYALVELAALDLFPQTKHVEVVGKFLPA